MSNNDNSNESNYFNKPIETTQSKESKDSMNSFAYKFAVGILALSLTVGTLTGCSGDKINATEPTPTQIEDYTEADSTIETESETSETTTAVLSSETTTSTPESTTTETTVVVETTTEITTEEESEPALDESIDYKMPPIDVVEGYSFNTLSPEQQSILLEIKDMSVDDFYEKLPIEDQMMYADWIFINNKGRVEQIIDRNHMDVTPYNENPVTAEDLVNNYAYMELFVSSLRVMNSDGGLELSMEDATKANSMVDLKTNSDDFLEYITAYLESIRYIPLYALVDTKVNAFVEIPDGMIINYTSKENTVTSERQITFRKMNFTDIYGNTKTVYPCSLSVGELDVRYIPNLGK